MTTFAPPVDAERATRRAAVSLDVDATRHYHAIHGLPPAGNADPALHVGLRRFLDLCGRLDLRATIFVVTRDLEDDAVADLVREAARAGHEIASHSHEHAYDLSRRAPAAIQSDLLRSRDVIEHVTHRVPRGFRAPGYNLSEALLDAVEQAGFLYDSSVMPSPAYFGVRAAAIAGHRVRGRVSSSLLGDPRAFAAPRTPYRLRRGQAHQRARSRVDGRDLVEVPISTLPLGLPWLGTTLALSPLALGTLHTALALRADPVVLELHAIDLCDQDDGFDAALVAQQRDLRVGVKKKLDRLAATLRMLAQACDVVTLEEIARTVDAKTGPTARPAT